MIQSIIENPFSEKVIEESAKALFDIVCSLGKKFGNKVIDEIKVKNALKSYTENYIERHGKVKVLGMSEPKPLLEIYTEVQIVSSNYLSKENSLDALESNFKSNRTFTAGNRESGIAVADREEKLNILGAPGSGKSTFLKRIGLEVLLLKNSSSEITTNYTHSCIPVLIELKRYRNEVKDLKLLIQNEFEIAGFPESDHFVTKALEAGKLLILLDGLDEVSNQVLDETIEHIKDFTDRYKANRFLTSCRTAFYKNFLVGFVDVEVAMFNDSQIKTFISNWFNLEKDIAAGAMIRLAELLFEKNNRATLELARTPLLLTFICLTFDDSQKFPANRSSLYRKALMILMEKWAAEKRIHNDDIYQNLNSDIELEMLSEMASSFYEEEKIFFYHHEIKSSIAIFLEKNLNVKNLPFSKIIEAIEIQQGLLVERAPEIYSFSHLTIQEYLTAYYYYSPGKINQIIERHLFDNRWREVFLLLAGMSNADELVIQMTIHLKWFAKETLLIRDTIHWINSIITKTENYEEDACKRIFFASLLLGFRRYDGRHFMDKTRLEDSSVKLLASIDRSLIQSLDINNNISKKEAIRLLNYIEHLQQKDVVRSLENSANSADYSKFRMDIEAIKPREPLSKMLPGGRQQYYNEILSVFYDALSVPENLKLSRNRYEKLLSYFEAYSLLVDCKNAALRISKEVWKKACLSLLADD